MLTEENSFFRAVEENLMEDLFIAHEKELRNSLEIVMNQPRAILTLTKKPGEKSSVTVTTEISNFEKGTTGVLATDRSRPFLNYSFIAMEK